MSGSERGVESGDSKSRFVVIGRRELRTLHEQWLRTLPYHFVFVDSLPELLCECVRQSPKAVLIDLAMIVKTKSDFGYLFELDVTFPFLRFVYGSNGAGVLMSMAPPKRAEIAASLAQIADGDTTWIPPDRRRRFMRMEIDCRARFRSNGDTDWTYTNVREISQGGCSIITVAPPQMNSTVELELLDLTPEPICFDAHVAWNTRWDAGPELPGAGLYWDTDSMPQGFRESLGTPERVKRIIRGLQPE